METCRVCGYTSPYVNNAEGTCPECWLKKQREFGERQREIVRRWTNRTKAELIALERHRWGRPHDSEFCIICKVEKSLT